jgi:hypothetical protein
VLALGQCLSAVAGLSLMGTAAPAFALITPAAVVDGPSPSVLGVGNVAMAPDGTGGVVWRRLSGGVPHIFVSRFTGGRWSRPIQVDVGQPGPATFPAIAAGEGGQLLVVWVQPWASESIRGQAPTTHYQLVSAVAQPGSQGFGPPEQVDPHDVGDGSGVYPSLTMAPNGSAYVVYRVVTNPLSPNAYQPPGTIAPMRRGDELVDVRVAQFNGLSWSSLGAVNALPGQVTMRKPTASNAPVIAVDRAHDALVVWQEPSIDGVARIWGRRLFGTTLGGVLAVSPQTLGGQPISVDADAPSLSLSDYAGAKVAFRLAGGPGSPLYTPHVFVNTMLSRLATNGATFTGPVAIGGGTTVSAPSVAVDDFGDFQAGFTAGGVTELVDGSETKAGAPQALGPSAGDPALATLDPDGGGAAVWPATDTTGRPVVHVRETLPDGGWQAASLSAPIAGPVSSLTIGPSGQGDAVIAFEQGLSSTAQVAVAVVQAPPHPFGIHPQAGWVKPGAVTIRWDPAPTAIGSVTYSVLIDGQVRASGLRGLSYRVRPRGLGEGVHHVRVIATDSASQQMASPPAYLTVDANPPFVSVRPLSGRRAQVRVHDPGSGPRPWSTLISFGDGSPPVRHKLSAVHRYQASGRYLITVHCVDQAGNSATDHLWVQAR